MLRYRVNAANNKNSTPYLATHGLCDARVDDHRVTQLLMDRFKVLLTVQLIEKLTSLTLAEKRDKLIQVLQRNHMSHYLWLLTNKGQAPKTPEEVRFMEDERIAHIFMYALFYPWTDIIYFLRTNEMIFFRWQTIAYETSNVLEFFMRNNINFEEATMVEKLYLCNALNTYQESYNKITIRKKIFKVPCISAWELFAKREVYRTNDFAYIPEHTMKRILPALYLNHMNYECQKEIYQHVDTKIMNQSKAFILRANLHTYYTGKVKKLRKLEMVFPLNKIDENLNYVPPCFRRMHDKLNQAHHLKFHSRRQYYLFLKGIGAQSSDVIAHIKKHFVDKGKMTEQEFKEHVYYIRHIFGELGSHIHYRTPSCMLNINAEAKIGEVHGCPFVANDDIEELGNHLTKWNIPIDTQDEILEYKASGQCSNACAAYFKGVHGVEPNSEIINPLDYYAESVAIGDYLSDIEGLVSGEMEDNGVFDGLYKDSGNEDGAVFLSTVRQRIRKATARIRYDFKDSDPWLQHARLMKKVCVSKPPPTRRCVMMPPKKSQTNQQELSDDAEVEIIEVVKRKKILGPPVPMLSDDKEVRVILDKPKKVLVKPRGVVNVSSDEVEVIDLEHEDIEDERAYARLAQRIILEAEKAGVPVANIPQLKIKKSTEMDL